MLFIFVKIFNLNVVKLKVLDVDSDSKISYTEFVSMIDGSIYDFKNEAQAKRFFNVFAKDDSGYISRENLNELYEFFGGKLDDNQLEEAMKRVDLNSDGKISYEGIICFF